MYARLGDIQFEGLRSFAELSRSEATDFAEVQRIGGKPSLQKTGEALVKYSLTTRLHRSFCDPDAESAKIRSYRDESSELPLVTGAGELLGVFVIQSITTETAMLHTDGTSWDISLRIELIEVSTPEPLGIPAQIAQVGAAEFDLTTVDLNVNSIQVQNVALASLQANEVANRLAAVQVFEAIASNPASAYAKAKQSVVRLQSFVGSIVAIKPNLAGLASSASALLSAIDAQDLTLALDSLDDVARRLRIDVVDSFKNEAVKSAAKL